MLRQNSNLRDASQENEGEYLPLSGFPDSQVEYSPNRMAPVSGWYSILVGD